MKKTAQQTHSPSLTLLISHNNSTPYYYSSQASNSSSNSSSNSHSYHYSQSHSQVKQRIQINQSCRMFFNPSTKTYKFLLYDNLRFGQSYGKQKLQQMLLAIDIQNTPATSTSSLNSKPKSKSNIVTVTITNTNLPKIGKKRIQILQSLRNYRDKNQLGYKLEEGRLIAFGDRRMRVVGMGKGIQRNISRYQDRQDNYKLRQKQNWGQGQMEEEGNATGSYLKMYKNCSESFYNYNESLNRRTEGPCRICLYQTDSENSVMLSPCKCKGTCSNIHYNCLKQWMKNKVSIQYKSNGLSNQERLIVLSFKKFVCQICKSNLPKCVNILENGKQETKYLFDALMPIDPYIILQQQQSQAIVQKWYILTFPKSHQQGPETPFYIGRSPTASLQLNPIMPSSLPYSWATISKIHAQIVFSNNNFYLKDLCSEYGTYVEMLPEETVRLEGRNYGGDVSINGNGRAEGIGRFFCQEREREKNMGYSRTKAKVQFLVEGKFFEFEI